MRAQWIQTSLALLPANGALEAQLPIEIQLDRKLL